MTRDTVGLMPSVTLNTYQSLFYLINKLFKKVNKFLLFII